MNKILTSTVLFFVGVSSMAQSAGYTVTFFDKPHHKASFCDQALKVNIDLDKKELTVWNEVVGECELFVTPDTRVYKVTGSRTACGTGILTGSNGNSRIELRDHTLGVCEDIKTALYEVIETSGLQSSNETDKFLFHGYSSK